MIFFPFFFYGCTSRFSLEAVAAAAAAAAGVGGGEEEEERGGSLLSWTEQERDEEQGGRRGFLGRGVIHFDGFSCARLEIRREHDGERLPREESGRN